jgi:hypothetical protein
LKTKKSVMTCQMDGSHEVDKSKGVKQSPPAVHRRACFQDSQNGYLAA